MTPRERFVHFVALFAPPEIREGVIEEAVRLPLHVLSSEHIDESGDLVVPALERPMDAAWEYVQYRKYSVPRPAWLPRLETVTPKLIR